MTEPEPTGSIDNLSNEEIDGQIQQLEAVIGRGTEPPEKPSYIGSEKHTEDMSKLFDKLNAKTAAEEHEKTPPTTPDETLTTAFENTYSWLNEKSAAERAEVKQNEGELTRIQENAKSKFNIPDLSREEALKIALDEERATAQQGGNLPAEFAPAVEGIKQLHPNEAPHAIMQKYVDINRAVMDKPVETLGGLYSNATGQHPLEMAVQMARQYSPAEHKEFYETRDAGLVTKTFMACNPDLDRSEMARAIMKLQSSGDDIKDLIAARDYVSKNRKQSGKSRARSMEAEMRDSYNAIAARDRR